MPNILVENMINTSDKSSLLVSTWSITLPASNFCLVSRIRTKRKVNMYPSNHKRMPCFWLAFLVPHANHPGYTESLSQFLLEAFLHFPVFESLPNASDVGWLPCYSKLWINVFCLFSFECSLFPRLEFHQNYYKWFQLLTGASKTHDIAICNFTKAWIWNVIFDMVTQEWTTDCPVQSHMILPSYSYCDTCNYWGNYILYISGNFFKRFWT